MTNQFFAIRNVNRDFHFAANRLTSFDNRRSAFCETCACPVFPEFLQWVTVSDEPGDSMWFGSAGLVVAFGMRRQVVRNIAHLLSGFHLLGAVTMSDRFIDDWVGLVPTRPAIVHKVNRDAPCPVKLCEKCGGPDWNGPYDDTVAIYSDAVPQFDVFSAPATLILSKRAIEQLRSVQIPGIALQFQAIPVELIEATHE